MKNINIKRWVIITASGMLMAFFVGFSIYYNFIKEEEPKYHNLEEIINNEEIEKQEDNKDVLELTENNQKINFHNQEMKIRTFEGGIYINEKKLDIVEDYWSWKKGEKYYIHNISGFNDFLLIEKDYLGEECKKDIIGGINEKGEFLYLKKFRNDTEFNVCLKEITLKDKYVYGIYQGKDDQNNKEIKYAVLYYNDKKENNIYTNDSKLVYKTKDKKDTLTIIGQKNTKEYNNALSAFKKEYENYYGKNSYQNRNIVTYGYLNKNVIEINTIIKEDETYVTFDGQLLPSVINGMCGSNIHGMYNKKTKTLEVNPNSEDRFYLCTYSSTFTKINKEYYFLYYNVDDENYASEIYDANWQKLGYVKRTDIQKDEQGILVYDNKELSGDTYNSKSLDNKKND